MTPAAATEHRHVALVRAINVGGNTRVPMAVLRAIFEEKHSGVVTLINSGNVVFTGIPDVAWLRSRLRDETGVDATMLILTADRFRAIAEAVPYDGDGDGAKIAVMFMGKVPSDIQIPADLAPELIHFGSDAVYQWLPDGFSGTKLKPAFWKQFPPETTGRNLNTVRKILALL